MSADYITEIEEERDRYAAALALIASCEKRADGDVVDIARNALSWQGDVPNVVRHQSVLPHLEQTADLPPGIDLLGKSWTGNLRADLAGLHDRMRSDPLSYAGETAEAIRRGAENPVPPKGAVAPIEEADG